MIVVMLGPPASGKGTQSKMVAQEFGIPHISTGDIFRWNIAHKTTAGIEAKKYIDKGLLVPDILTIEILKDRIEMEDCINGFVLDGFPRTLAQQEALDEMLAESERTIGIVINLNVSDQEVIRRMGGRRVCECGKAYHIDTYPPKQEGICDVCGGKLYTRDDDTLEVIQTRLETFKRQKEPIIAIYRQQGKLVDVDGNQAQEDVSEDVLAKVAKCVLEGVV